jgi:AraC-like DNA-binding protein
MFERSDHLDLLSSILNSYSLEAHIYAQPAVCGAFQVGGDHTPDDACASFHLLGRGHGWLHMQQFESPVALKSGDLILFPGNAWHLITQEPELNGTGEILITEGSGPVSSFLCGSIHIQGGNRNPIMEALPDLILVRAEDGGERLENLARLMVSEAACEEFGSDIALDKLADVLFVLAIRHHIERASDQSGLLAAMSDRRLSRALEAMHHQPGENWSVAQLAERAGMSRTAFSNRFGEVMGQSPIGYLTHWRMQEATRLLQTQKVTVAELSERFGYETEAAFRRAFKRVTGRPPGAVRG